MIIHRLFPLIQTTPTASRKRTANIAELLETKNACGLNHRHFIDFVCFYTILLLQSPVFERFGPNLPIAFV
jgi:hypothetical protein